MQAFVCVCVCAHGGLFAPSLGVWMAPVCPASHLSPLQDKGSSVSGPLLRLLEMIWSVLLSTEKIISSQRGCPSALQAPASLRDKLHSPSSASVASRSDGHRERGSVNKKTDEHIQRKLKGETDSAARAECMRKE